MAIITQEADIDVLQAARQRIINVFSNGLPIYLSTSGGKDSIVLCDITYNLIKEGLIDPKQLTVMFVDEEGMYDDVIEIVMAWRKKFILAGAKFEWYCIEVKHFCCLNSLTQDETYICWDRYERDKWMRQPPPFAIMTHPLLDARMENYQSFMGKRTRDGICMIGCRASESIQRRINMANKMFNTIGDGKFFPIYDWKDNDIWLYLFKNRVDFPITYVHLWQVGTPKKDLRISQFFSIDSIKSLVRMAEFEPELMNRVTRREPNAYMVALYFDSEMFRRSTKQRKLMEKSDDKDYKKLAMQKVAELGKYGTTEVEKAMYIKYRYTMMKAIQYNSSPAIWKKMHDGLVAGDPKGRTARAVNLMIFEEHKSASKKGEK